MGEIKLAKRFRFPWKLPHSMGVGQVSSNVAYESNTWPIKYWANLDNVGPANSLRRGDTARNGDFGVIQIARSARTSFLPFSINIGPTFVDAVL